LAPQSHFQAKDFSDMDAKSIRGALRHILTHPDQSNRMIGEQRSCSPTTIGRYRKLINGQCLAVADIGAMTDSEIMQLVGRTGPQATTFLEPDWERDILDLNRGDSRVELHDRYVAGATGAAPMSYRTYCKRLADRLPATDPTMRLVHRAGETMMVDFAGYQPKGLLYGELSDLALFVAIVPASQYIFARVVASQRVPDWLSACEAMLRYYDGTASLIVPDNLKSAIIERPRGKEPVVQRDFQMFCDHYGSGVRPTRPRHPQDKALVENAVKIVQRRLRRALRDRPPMTMTQMNGVLDGILAIVNGLVLRRFPGESRSSRFASIDKPVLKPVTVSPFVYYDITKSRKVPRDYHIDCDDVYYSVPHRLIGKPVELRANTTTVEIFHDGKPVAVHPRGGAPGSAVTTPAHMPPGHRAWRALDEANLGLWAEDYDDAVQEVAAVEMMRGYIGTVRIKRYKLFDALVREFGRDRFEAACARALANGRPDLPHIRNLLANGLERAALAATATPKKSRRATKNVRGAHYYGEDRPHA
jgi:transposase